MSKTVRLIIFLIFLFAFLVSAPMVVLYTAGYRLDLSHGRIVHTAVLNIMSQPRNALVMIDAVEQSDLTPAVIETVLPGEHTITLSKQGYLAWKTTLAFESREARVLGPIMLFLDESAQNQKSFTAKLVSFHAPTNRFAYATQESSWLEVWIVEAQNAQTSLLMRVPYDATGTYAFSWSKDGAYLALTKQHGSQEDITISRVSDGTSIDLPNETRNILDSWWDLEAEPYLYVRTATSVMRLDVSNGTKQEILHNPQTASLFNGSQFILSQSNNRAVVTKQNGETASIITYLPLGEYAFVQAPSDLIALFDRNHQRLVLLDPSNREQPILLNEEALLWEWNQSGDILLYSSGYDLKQYLRSSHETRTLTRLSTAIDSLAWFPAGSCVLYQAGSQIIALNLHEETILSQNILIDGAKGSWWINSDGTSLSRLVQTEEGWEWQTRELQN